MFYTAASQILALFTVDIFMWSYIDNKFRGCLNKQQLGFNHESVNWLLRRCKIF